MTTNSVGTGKTYSTVQLWRADCPADLVSTTQTWIGELYNEELTFTASVNFTGITTSSTYYVELKTATGEGFRDSSSNPLRYGTTGARITSSTYATPLFTITGGQQNIRFTGLQLQQTAVLANFYAVNAASSTDGIQIDRCIIQIGANGTNFGAAQVQHSSGYIARSVIIMRQAVGASCVVNLTQGANCYSSILACTTVGGAARGFDGAYIGTSTIRNTGIFGATAVAATPLSGTRTFTTCYTNVASPPSGCTTTDLSTSTGAKFTNITDGTHDYKITTGSSMAGTGTADSTYFPTDIFGTTAASPPSVGPFELNGGGGGGSPAMGRSIWMTA